MRTDKLIQYGLATTKAAAEKINPNRSSTSQGMKYLRVLPLAGFARFPIKVELAGSKSGQGKTEFLAGEWQFVECDSARVVPSAMAEVLASGSQFAFQPTANSGPLDPDATVDPLFFPSNGASQFAATFQYCSGLYAFQWSNDPIEINNSPVPERLGMVPAYRWKIHNDLSSTATTIVLQDFQQPPKSAGFRGIKALMLGCGYSAIRHTFDTLPTGAAPAAVTLHKWIIDPWAKDPLSNTYPLVYAGDLVVAGPNNVIASHGQSSVVVDEAIDLPDRPTWMMLTCDLAVADTIFWTLEIS